MQLNPMGFHQIPDTHKSARGRNKSGLSNSDSQVQTTINNQYCDLLKGTNK